MAASWELQAVSAVTHAEQGEWCCGPASSPLFRRESQHSVFKVSCASFSSGGKRRLKPFVAKYRRVIFITRVERGILRCHLVFTLWVK